MALSDDTINRYADACTPNTETGALNYKAFASVIEAAVRKQDTELIRQMLDALELPGTKNHQMLLQCAAAERAARARLETKS